MTNLQWVDRKLVGNRCDTRYITEQAFVDCFNDFLLHIYQVATNLLAASLLSLDEINSLLQTVSRVSEIKYMITFSKYTLNILR